MGSPEWLTRSVCDVLSTLWTERKTGRDRERGERQREYSRNGMDDHKGEGTKQEEVTDFGTHGKYFNHRKWQAGLGALGFNGDFVVSF